MAKKGKIDSCSIMSLSWPVLHLKSTAYFVLFCLTINAFPVFTAGVHQIYINEEKAIT